MTPEELAAQKAAEEAAAKKAAEEAAAKKAAEEAEAAKKKEEEDAKNKLTDKEAALLKDVMKKKEALENATKAKEALEAKLKEFDGIDPVAIKKLIADQKAAEELEAVRKGEWEKVKAQMNEAHQKELNAVAGKLAEKDTEIGNLNKTIADITVGSSFTGSKFVHDDLALTPNKARALYGAHFEYKDGKVVGYDKPAGQKDRAPLVDGKGEPLSFDEAFKKIIEADPDKDSLLKSKIGEGAASSTGKPGGKEADGGKKDEKKLTPIEKIAAGLEAASKKK
jgi:hypothetical protein